MPGGEVMSRPQGEAKGEHRAFAPSRQNDVPKALQQPA